MRLYPRTVSAPCSHPELDTITASVRAELQRRYGAELVALVLFGSQARRDASPSSDVDLLVVLRDPIDPLEEQGRLDDFAAELSLAFDTVITWVIMGESRFRTAQTPLLLNVRREGIAI